MAEATELEHVPVTRNKRGKVDWDEFCDGRVWRLKPGEDFDGKPEGIMSRARSKARDRGYRADVAREESSKRGAPDNVLVQFIRETASTDHDSSGSNYEQQPHE